MASGCLLFIGFQKRKSIEQFLEKVPPMLVLAFIIGVMYLPMSLATTSTFAVVVLSLVLIASLKKGTASYTFFTHPKVVYIGLISYSLYLWHWGVLSISRWTIGIYWWTIPLQVALMLGLAIASYQYIETPLRKGNWFGKRWKTFVVGGGVIVTLTSCIFTLDERLKNKLFTGNRNNKSYVTYLENNITYSPILPSPFLRTIYLIGDSHAAHYEELITSIANKKRFKFVMIPQGVSLKLLTRSNEEDVLTPLQEYKKRFKKGDVIIFSAHINKYYKNGQDWTKRYETLLRETQNIGIKFILISPTPIFSDVKSAYICQEEWYRPSSAISPICQVNKSEWFTNNNVPISKIEKFLLGNPKVSYIDAFSIICPDPYCKNHDDHSLMYIDESHLTSYGAMKLYKTIETLIRSK